ncbi:hypothetical protein SAMN05880545_1942, partial [Microbacterium sp. RU33B]
MHLAGGLAQLEGHAGYTGLLREKVRVGVENVTCPGV